MVPGVGKVSDRFKDVEGLLDVGLGLIEESQFVSGQARLVPRAVWVSQRLFELGDGLLVAFQCPKALRDHKT
jgi:hypothetical protein